MCNEHREDSGATKRDGTDKVVERVAEGRLQGGGGKRARASREGGRRV